MAAIINFDDGKEVLRLNKVIKEQDAMIEEATDSLAIWMGFASIARTHLSEALSEEIAAATKAKDRATITRELHVAALMKIYEKYE